MKIIFMSTSHVRFESGKTRVGLAVGFGPKTPPDDPMLEKAEHMLRDYVRRNYPSITNAMMTGDFIFANPAEAHDFYTLFSRTQEGMGRISPIRLWLKRGG